MNVDIEVQENGDMLVSETQKYVFNQPYKNQRYRSGQELEVKVTYATDILNISKPYWQQFNSVKQQPASSPSRSNSVKQQPARSATPNNSLKKQPQPSPTPNNSLKKQPQPSPTPNNSLKKQPQPS
ncbi:MAG: hypothetical protein WBA77_09540, partial [Microcoleaceae cyanobacterium]